MSDTLQSNLERHPKKFMSELLASRGSVRSAAPILREIKQGVEVPFR